MHLTAFDKFLERLLSVYRILMTLVFFQNLLQVLISEPSWTPVLSIRFLSTSFANTGKWSDAYSDMIPQTPKKWQQIFPGW